MSGSGFSTQEITNMLGLSASRVRAYVKAGLLCPQRGHGGELRFSFQDLLLLRTAEGLVTERLPPRRVRDELRKLRQRLPTERPLTGVQLDNDGDHVVVRDGARAWRADSGQVLLAFAGAGAGADASAASAPAVANAAPAGITELRPRTRSPVEVGRNDNGGGPDDYGEAAGRAGGDRQPTAGDYYQLGRNLEDAAPDAAAVAYRRAIELSPGHADAHINLGRLVHEAGDIPAAERHYRAALALRPKDATALFDLGVVLEDQGRTDDALAMYEEAARVEPAHADAHFNAARLHDIAGRYEPALRHLREYRNLRDK